MTQAPSGSTSDASGADEAPATFDVLPLSPAVRRAVDEMGFSSPTPVQRAVFEPAARGADLVVQARTGTGKTAAFGLPVVDRLVRVDEAKVQILVLSPTRELALQINRQLEQLAAYNGVRTTAVYGGAAMQPQIDALASGVHVVAGTPGRVLDHLERGTLRVDGIRAVVLDESDEMLSMGFLPQITAILEQLPRPHQTLLFSATVPPAVRRIAENRLTNPEFITLSGDHIGALEIEHYVYTSRGDKASELAQIIEIENPESAIVFCNTREQTKRIAGALQKRGFSADWLNADLSQSDREKVMASTRESKLRFLVATDVAARGIDISHLTHVINADFPESTENYVHRTGRTGRAGRTGTAISLIAPQDVGNLYMLRLTYKIFPVARELPSARDLQTRKEADLVEFLAEAFPRPSLHVEDLSLARRILASERAEAIVAGLLRDHLGARPGAADEAASARREKAPAAQPAGEGRRSEGRRSEGSSERGEGRFDDERSKKKKKDKKRKKKHDRERDDEPRAETGDVAAFDDQSRGNEDETARDSFEDKGGAPERYEGDVLGDEPSRQQEPERRGAKPERREERAAAPRPDEAPSTVQGFETISASQVLADLREADDTARIFVDVGRKDGAYREDFIEALEEQGFEAEDVHYVKVRDSHTFVGVPADLLDRALDVLDGASIAGVSARAEKARVRS